MVQSKPKVIQLEFNELSPQLLARFIDEGHLPNFKRVYDTSAIYTSKSEENVRHLEPWIQWVSVHSGLTFSQHGIFTLGDGRNLDKKCLAEVLSEAGIRVGAFAPMNANYTKLLGYYLPDPWDRLGIAHPPELNGFYSVWSSQVQEASRSKLTLKDAWALGRFLITHGLRAKTIFRAVKQLISEVFDAGLKWRRAALLDELNYDLFRYLNQKHGVEFASFFSNSTAHFQHYYWRNFEPGAFEIPDVEKGHASLSGAILHGYKTQDRLVGEVLKDYPDATILLCTGLSQQAWKDTQKCIYRPKNMEHFLSSIGIEIGNASVKPVMAQQFHIDFKTQAQAQNAAQILESLTCGGKPLMYVVLDEKSVFTGCMMEAQDFLSMPLTLPSGKSVRASDFFYRIYGMRSGRHHPEGALWIRQGKNQVFKDPVSITRIAPTVLSWFHVNPPAHMAAAPL